MYIQTKKLLGDTEENLGVTGFGEKFLDTRPTQSVKDKLVKLDFIKIKNFCSAKKTLLREKRQGTD